MLPGLRGDGDRNAVLGQALLDEFDLEVDYFLDLLGSQRVEDDYLVDAVQKLRPETALQGFEHLGLVLGGFTAAFFVSHAEPERFGGCFDVLTADVRGHDDDGVLEIHHLPLPVGEAPVVQYLEKQVEDLGVGFFDLVEKNDAVGPVADGLGDLAALFVAHISRRRTDKARGGVPLHVLGHVDSHQGLLVVEHELGQRPGELRLPDARRPEKHEGAQGAMRIGKSGPSAPERGGDGLHGFVLADHALVKCFFYL